MNPGLNWYEDCGVGDAFATGGIVVTESLIQAFAGLSGDFFDLHMDDRFARDLGFKLVGHRLQLFGVPLRRGRG